MTRQPVFVSYAHPDAEIASAIVASIEEQGMRCWVAPRDVTPDLRSYIAGKPATVAQDSISAPVATEAEKRTDGHDSGTARHDE